MKILIYKTATGQIAENIPTSKEVMQKELSNIDVSRFVEMHIKAMQYEQKFGSAAIVDAHSKKIAWAKNIANYNSISDKEHEAFMESHVPTNACYSFWIDNTLIKGDRNFRDAWKDMDTSGNVTYDLEKARQIQLARNHAAKQNSDLTLAKTLAMGADPLSTAVLNSIDDLQGASYE